MINFYRKFISEGDLCFDLGANKGERTDCFLKLGAKVISVEPQRSCFNALQKKYGNCKQVDVLHCAVGSGEREDELMICDETDECSTFSKEFVSAYSNISKLHWNKTEKISVTTLESLCATFGLPKFCKIDVEGYESEVLLSLKTPIKFICFEFNRPLLYDTVKCLEILDLLGNYQCNYIKYESMKLVLREWLPAKEFQKQLEQFITPEILTGEIIATCLD